MSEITTTLQVWIVMEAIDYGMDGVAAVYSSASLADQHVAELGGWVVPSTVSDTIAPEVIDPAACQQRAAAAEQARKDGERYNAERQRERESRQNSRPNELTGLCHCAAWSPTTPFVNQYGYCTFCGGASIAAFRALRGEGALQSAIDELAKHHRERMRSIATVTP